MLRYLFYLLVVKPLVSIVLGINVRHRERLITHGSALIVANHNSHLDALALMSLFPQNAIANVHPVAAADYFLTNRFLKWFALNIIGIIPINRNEAASGRDVLKLVLAALDRNAVLIFFPEGTRGEPENMGRMKNGIASIVAMRPQVPVTPVFFYGLGKSLPKGEIVLAPFFIDAFVGKPLLWGGNKQDFMAKLNAEMSALQEQARQAAARTED
ncbi:MAG: 1-acyl-sn-glycerol-3-phosphate acyltransferase [Gammaproteobacteria bacterium]|nr:1-acyl-sn-glycerol-3-phosphate acyltransferase [Gammaproteobacteria bacterium]